MLQLFDYQSFDYFTIKIGPIRVIFIGSVLSNLALVGLNPKIRLKYCLKSLFGKKILLKFAALILGNK